MGIFPILMEFEGSLPNCRKLPDQQKMGTFLFLYEYSHFYVNFPNFNGIWRKRALLSKATKSAKIGNFPISMGFFPYLCGNLKKACPIVKSYVFSKKWELSHFYRTFPIFMGIGRKLAQLSKATWSAKNGNFPIFIWIFPFLLGIFPILIEFEECLPYCRKLRVQQKMGFFPFL